MAQERIDKILAFLGVGTRKEVKKICRSGAVTVNGVPVKDSSEKIDPETDELVFDGQVLHYRKHIYVMLNKPAGVISATEDYLHKTVTDILPEEYQVFEPFPVGRLDKDTEGLLILTNDGQFSHQLLSPKKHVDKMYYVEVNRSLTEGKILELEQGVTLEDGYHTMPAKVQMLVGEEVAEQIIPQGLQAVIPEQPVSPYCKQRFLLTIQEGKFHQIKRMAEAVGSEVVYLKRLSMGNIILDSKLSLGDCRELTEEEINNF
ncbi:pseudouridine synthase [Desulfuribacillus alkaliarsenatis]|uniref:Pseudouridine synthase n=1 Tax=Desulfuribacillus alkaliarsenatis TaxID=766136 RepID=A0A1E5G1E0_9FIRM|nr:pseudouridine synthase [Desulfuribacillus alkaliarsenatis]OEF96728.1 16S rRNA pseudouridine(516) synthase [Desulfuribacillus alkaliarsenatis]